MIFILDGVCLAIVYSVQNITNWFLFMKHNGAYNNFIFPSVSQIWNTETGKEQLVGVFSSKYGGREQIRDLALSGDNQRLLAIGYESVAVSTFTV